MEYLKSIDDIDKEINEDKVLIQECLFGKEYAETCLDEICPICKVNTTYRNWWCCKECSHLTISKFNEELIKNFK